MFSWTTFLLAALKALPEIISLVQAWKIAADAKANRGIGYDQAVADGAKVMRTQLAAADEAVAEAEKRQAAHPGSDEGLDTNFRRD